MKHTWNKAAWALLASPMLFTACKKNDHGTLEGPVPVASFTSVVNASQYPVTVTFTDNSQDAGFVNQWEFGDGTIGTGKTVTHTYNQAGTYKVRLTEAGRGGTAATPQTDVVVPSLCGQSAFSVLVNCQSNVASAKVFTYSNAAGAVKRLDASNNVISSSAANSLTSCQADDQFTFSGTSASYTYEANGGTFANGACGDSKSGSGSFIYKPGTGTSLGQIILQNAGSFIGEPVAVNNLTYDIIEASSTVLRLRGTLADGTKTEVTLVPFDALTRVKQLLTGGTQKTWLLDNVSVAPILVGTESNPSQYYAGNPAGGGLPGCQADDEFTFSAANVYTYNALTETFVAGSPGTCQAPRSTSTPFTFTVPDGAGLAQLTLANAGTFIGVTDAPDLVYRIISITDKTMLLRAGSGKNGGTVFTMKLIAK